jgi:hypothetical protein
MSILNPAIFTLVVAVLNVEPIVMLLSAFVMLTFVPAVKVPTAGPLVPPIRSEPLSVIGAAVNAADPESCVIRTDLSVRVLNPVPPLTTDKTPDAADKSTDVKNKELVLSQLAKSI